MGSLNCNAALLNIRDFFQKHLKQKSHWP